MGEIQKMSSQIQFSHDAVQILDADGQLLSTYSIMHQLRPTISQHDYLPLVRQLQAEVGYRIASLTYESRPICVTGFRFCRSLGWGKYLYVDDLVTDHQFRSRGAGKFMFSWLLRFAGQNKCNELRLDSAVERHGAHRFYLRARMDIACFNFRLPITGNLDSVRHTT